MTAENLIVLFCGNMAFLKALASQVYFDVPQIIIVSLRLRSHRVANLNSACDKPPFLFIICVYTCIYRFL